MEYIPTTYDKDELAWVSDITPIEKNAYLCVELKKPGKLVIRQNAGNGRRPRLPISKHSDTTKFELRLKVVSQPMDVQIFTSAEPKEIKYAYI